MITNNKKNKVATIASLLAMVVLLCAYNLWMIIDISKDSYFIFIALSFPIFFGIIMFLISKHTIFTFSSLFICLWLSIANLLDECFFDPVTIQIQEYAYAFIGMIGISLGVWWNWKKNVRK